MAFNVTGLSEYTQKATEILRESVMFADNYGEYDVMVGVQHKKYLNYIDAAPVLQAGACNLSAQGNTTFTEKEIQVFPIAVRDEWCIDDLNEKDLNFNTGTLNGKMTSDVRAALIGEETDKIKQLFDTMVYQGDTGSGDLFDGFLTKMTNDVNVLTIPSVLVALGNIDDILVDMVLAIPQDMWSRGMMTIHLPLNFYNLYKQNRTNSNFYHDDPKTNKGILSMPMFGWEGRVMIVAEPGMNGADQIFLTWNKNLVIASDEIQEVSRAKIYFDENTDLVKYKASWKFGVEYKYSKEIILFTSL